MKRIGVILLCAVLAAGTAWVFAGCSAKEERSAYTIHAEL